MPVPCESPSGPEISSLSDEAYFVAITRESTRQIRAMSLRNNPFRQPASMKMARTSIRIISKLPIVYIKFLFYNFRNKF